MSNYDLLRSNQQLEESEATSDHTGTKKNSRKNKSKTKKNKKDSSITKTTKKTKETEPTLRDLASGNAVRNVLRLKRENYN